MEDISRPHGCTALRMFSLNVAQRFFRKRGRAYVKLLEVRGQWFLQTKDVERPVK